MPKPWTPERRAAQAARIRELKPWTKSTGPRTREGKKRASRNAIKHGNRRALRQQVNEALTHQREFIRLVRATMLEPEFRAILRQAQTNCKEIPAETEVSENS